MNEEAYLALLRDLIDDGRVRRDRTGTGTRSHFGRQLHFDLTEGFPLLTTKRLHLPSIVHELLWFLSGSTNIGYLNDNGVRIWDAWANHNGDLGPVYGAQWRSWPDYRKKDPEGDSIDQIKRLEDGLRNDPFSRRHIISAWNVADIEDMALPPCHCLSQFYVTEDERLFCQLYQRSADMFLGVPFNIASYALLTCMLAEAHGLKPGLFVHTFGDLHLYENHVEQAELQLQREIRPAPRLRFKRPFGSVLDVSYDDIEIIGYDPHPAISAPVAV